MGLSDGTSLWERQQALLGAVREADRSEDAGVEQIVRQWQQAESTSLQAILDRCSGYRRKVLRLLETVGLQGRYPANLRPAPDDRGIEEQERQLAIDLKVLAELVAQLGPLLTKAKADADAERRRLGQEAHARRLEHEQEAKARRLEQEARARQLQSELEAQARREAALRAGAPLFWRGSYLLLLMYMLFCFYPSPGPDHINDLLTQVLCLLGGLGSLVGGFRVVNMFFDWAALPAGPAYLRWPLVPWLWAWKLIGLATEKVRPVLLQGLLRYLAGLLVLSEGTKWLMAGLGTGLLSLLLVLGFMVLTSVAFLGRHDFRGTLRS